MARSFFLVLILALTVMTFSVQMLKSTFLQLGADLEEAGRVNGGSFWFTLRHILLPLMLPAIAVVAVMVFGSVSRQVGSIVLLTTGESEPLSVLQMGYLMAEDYSAAAVVGTLLVSMGVLFGAFSQEIWPAIWHASDLRRNIRYGETHKMIVDLERSC